MIPRNKIDEIRDKIDLFSIISERVILKKMGKNYKGLCPFHSEKTPSFFVNAEKQMYHCFGCGEGGDVFHFLMKFENRPFLEVTRELAHQVGIPLEFSEPPTNGEKESKEILCKVNRYAAWFFAQNLKKNQGGATGQYLESRGISTSTRDEFKIGFSPEPWDSLVKFLKSKEAPLPSAETAGLIRKRQDGSYYDFFRNRLMFPIMDLDGRFIGFGGRRLKDENESKEVKYINSQESPIYHKGASLYGLYQAKKSIREKDEVILVEGYLDLITLFQAGLKNIVAPLGTALTLNHIKTLHRLTNHFVIMFDGDSAGLTATLRAILILFEAGIHPRVVIPPGEADPDLWLRQEGPEKIMHEVSKALPAMEWLILSELAKTGSRVSQKVEAARKIMPYINALPTLLEQKSYRSKLFNCLNLTEDDLSKKITLQKSPPPVLWEKEIVPHKEGKISLERILVELYVRAPHLLNRFLDEEIFQQFEDEDLKKLALKFVKEFESKGSVSLVKFLDYDSSPHDSLITQLGIEPIGLGESPSGEPPLAGKSEDGDIILETMALDCLKKWRMNRFKEELKKITGDIHQAELKGDQVLLSALMAKKSKVAKSLRE